jgi:hypothetical protein
VESGVVVENADSRGLYGDAGFVRRLRMCEMEGRRWMPVTEVGGVVVAVPVAGSGRMASPVYFGHLPFHLVVENVMHHYLLGLMLVL